MRALLLLVIVVAVLAGCGSSEPKLAAPPKITEFIVQSQLLGRPMYETLVTPSKDLEVKEQMRRVEAAFDLLPADYREAITLHKLCGLSHAEIAERMQKSEGAVRNLVYRGISRLAMLLDGGDTEV